MWIQIKMWIQKHNQRTFAMIVVLTIINFWSLLLFLPWKKKNPKNYQQLLLMQMYSNKLIIRSCGHCSSCWMWTSFPSHPLRAADIEGVNATSGQVGRVCFLPCRTFHYMGELPPEWLQINVFTHSCEAVMGTSPSLHLSFNPFMFFVSCEAKRLFRG